MTTEIWITVAILANLASVAGILYCLRRNYTITKENSSLVEKIGKAMVMMKELRDMLDRDLHDPLTAGNVRQKEVSH
jgi:hypothetical protein